MRGNSQRAVGSHPSLDASLSTVDLVELSGATYRQLDYWSRTGTLVAATEARGSGTQRQYTLRQAYTARLLTLLASLGARAPALRAAADHVACRSLEGAIIATPDRVDPVDAIFSVEGGWLVNLTAVREYVDKRMRSRALRRKSHSGLRSVAS